jgi:hypothetical protein
MTMKNFANSAALFSAAALAVLALPAHGALIISEVDPAGSSNGTGYLADWFELTNTGAAAVTITGWKMDDNSNAFASAVALNGVTSIAAGQSVVFIETSNLATAQTAFVNTWFGGTAPAGFAMGSYSGSGVGLSSTADAVNIFDSTGTLVTRVDFNAATTTKTFDNAAGLDNVVISQLSAVGVNGAFAGTDGRIGSPGTISAVPVPAAAWLFGGALGLLGATRRRTAR